METSMGCIGRSLSEGAVDLMQSRAAQERRRELNTFDLSEITRGDLINMIVEPSEPSYRRTEQGTIQHGGFCVVVKAWDDTKQKALAIKILNSMITNVDAWRPYLVAAYQEVLLTKRARLLAPMYMKQHFLQIHGVHLDERDHICIAMELCNVKDMQERMQKMQVVREILGGRLLGYPIEAVQGIMWQLLRILVVLKHADIVHRDIKLENLLVGRRIAMVAPKLEGQLDETAGLSKSEYTGAQGGAAAPAPSSGEPTISSHLDAPRSDAASGTSAGSPGALLIPMARELSGVTLSRGGGDGDRGGDDDEDDDEDGDGDGDGDGYHFSARLSSESSNGQGPAGTPLVSHELQHGLPQASPSSTVRGECEGDREGGHDTASKGRGSEMEVQGGGDGGGGGGGGVGIGPAGFFPADAARSKGSKGAPSPVNGRQSQGQVQVHGPHLSKSQTKFGTSSAGASTASGFTSAGHRMVSSSDLTSVGAGTGSSHAIAGSRMRSTAVASSPMETASPLDSGAAMDSGRTPASDYSDNSRVPLVGTVSTRSPADKDEDEADVVESPEEQEAMQHPDFTSMRSRVERDLRALGPHPGTGMSTETDAAQVFRSEDPEHARYIAEKTDAKFWAVPPKQGGHVLVLGDFGLATELFNKDVMYAKTPGTGQYIAPELFYEGTKDEMSNPAGKQDMFSAGVLMHILLTGYKPFRARQPMRTEQQQGQEKGQAKETSAGDSSRGAADIVGPRSARGSMLSDVPAPTASISGSSRSIGDISHGLSQPAASRSREQATASAPRQGTSSGNKRSASDAFQIGHHHAPTSDRVFEHRVQRPDMRPGDADPRQILATIPQLGSPCVQREWFKAQPRLAQSLMLRLLAKHPVHRPHADEALRSPFFHRTDSPAWVSQLTSRRKDPVVQRVFGWDTRPPQAEQGVAADARIDADSKCTGRAMSSHASSAHRSHSKRVPTREMSAISLRGQVFPLRSSAAARRGTSASNQSTGDGSSALRGRIQSAISARAPESGPFTQSRGASGEFPSGARGQTKATDAGGSHRSNSGGNTSRGSSSTERRLSSAASRRALAVRREGQFNPAMGMRVLLDDAEKMRRQGDAPPQERGAAESRHSRGIRSTAGSLAEDRLASGASASASAAALIGPEGVRSVATSPSASSQAAHLLVDSASGVEVHAQSPLADKSGAPGAASTLLPPPLVRRESTRQDEALAQQIMGESMFQHVGQFQKVKELVSLYIQDVRQSVVESGAAAGDGEDVLDIDELAHLNYEDFRSLMRKAGFDHEYFPMERLFQMLDQDSSDSIDVRELVLGLLPLLQSDSEEGVADLMFNVLDLDGDGSVSLDEVRRFVPILRSVIDENDSVRDAVGLLASGGRGGGAGNDGMDSAQHDQDDTYGLGGHVDVVPRSDIHRRLTTTDADREAKKILSIINPDGSGNVTRARFKEAVKRNPSLSQHFRMHIQSSMGTNSRPEAAMPLVRDPSMMFPDRNLSSASMLSQTSRDSIRSLREVDSLPDGASLPAMDVDSAEQHSLAMAASSGLDQGEDWSSESEDSTMASLVSGRTVSNRVGSGVSLRMFSSTRDRETTMAHEMRVGGISSARNNWEDSSRTGSESLNAVALQMGIEEAVGLDDAGDEMPVGLQALEGIAEITGDGNESGTAGSMSDAESGMGGVGSKRRRSAASVGAVSEAFTDLDAGRNGGGSSAIGGLDHREEVASAGGDLARGGMRGAETGAPDSAGRSGPGQGPGPGSGSGSGSERRTRRRTGR